MSIQIVNIEYTEDQRMKTWTVVDLSWWIRKKHAKSALPYNLQQRQGKKRNGEIYYSSRKRREQLNGESPPSVSPSFLRHKPNRRWWRFYGDTSLHTQRQAERETDPHESPIPQAWGTKFKELVSNVSKWKPEKRVVNNRGEPGEAIKVRDVRSHIEVKQTRHHFVFAFQPRKLSYFSIVSNAICF